MAHPIENIMKTTMEEIKQMVDVNTVVGTPTRIQSKRGILFGRRRIRWGKAGKRPVPHCKERWRTGHGTGRKRISLCGGIHWRHDLDPLGILVRDQRDRKGFAGPE